MKSTIFFSIVVIAFLSLSLYADEMPLKAGDDTGAAVEARAYATDGGNPTLNFYLRAGVAYGI